MIWCKKVTGEIFFEIHGRNHTYNSHGRFKKVVAHVVLEKDTLISSLNENNFSDIENIYKKVPPAMDSIILLSLVENNMDKKNDFRKRGILYCIFLMLSHL